jgi:hypothetical protein
MEFKLMSNYTSFVAVEQSYQVDPNGERKTVIVPVEMPESVSYDGVFGKEKKDVSPSITSLSSGYAQTEVDGKQAYNKPAPTSVPYKPVQPSSPSVISINTESLKISKNSQELELKTAFDFTTYLKNSEEKKSFTKVQVFRSGELRGEITSTGKEKIEKPGVYPSGKDKKNIILAFGKSPFITSGEYTIIIEIYNENGISAGKGVVVVDVTVE